MNSGEARARVATYVHESFMQLIGKQVRAIRLLSDEEIEEMDWYQGGCPCWAIVFTDGTILVPSADPEGNGPGWGFVFSPDDEEVLA